MKQIKENLKDWEIAKDMFNNNDKKHCQIVKKLRSKPIEIIPIDNDFSNIRLINVDDCGYVISNLLCQ